VTVKRFCYTQQCSILIFGVIHIRGRFVKHCGFIVYKFFSKLVSLSKPFKVNDNSEKALAYFVI